MPKNYRTSFPMNKLIILPGRNDTFSATRKAQIVERVRACHYLHFSPEQGSRGENKNRVNF